MAWQPAQHHQPIKIKTSLTQPIRCQSYYCTFSLPHTFSRAFPKFLIGLLRRYLWCDWLWFLSFATVIMKKLHQLKNTMFIYYRKLTFLTINCSRGVFFLTNLGTNLNCAWASVVLPKIPIVTGQEDSNSSVNNLPKQLKLMAQNSRVNEGCSIYQLPINRINNTTPGQRRGR